MTMMRKRVLSKLRAISLHGGTPPITGNVTEARPRVTPASDRGVGWLPQEIINSIVDLISDDVNTLHACTQLSTTWCTAAYVYLYWTFKVPNPAGLEAEVHRFQKMGVIGNVRRVVVGWDHCQEGLIFKTLMTSLEVIKDIQEPHRSMDIQELHLSNPKINELVLKLCDNCDILKSAVRTLVLNYPTASSTNCILWFVSLFSKLENLSVCGLHIRGTDNSKVPKDIKRPPPLTGRLVLTSIDKQHSDFIRGLVSMQKKFRTVELRSCEGVREIVKSCAKTTERLVWKLDNQFDIKNLKFLHLRHVEVNISSVLKNSANHIFYKFIFAISSPRLETCIISFHGCESTAVHRFQASDREKCDFWRWRKQSKRDVEVMFAGKPELIEAAMLTAIKDGMFFFLTKPPTLKPARPLDVNPKDGFPKTYYFDD